MARPLRIESAGAVYHITSRGNERKAVYKGDVSWGIGKSIGHEVRGQVVCWARKTLPNEWPVV